MAEQEKDMELVKRLRGLYSAEDIGRAAPATIIRRAEDAER